MKTDPKSKKMRQDRYDELKMILEEHRLAIVGELQNNSKIKIINDKTLTNEDRDLKEDRESTNLPQRGKLRLLFGVPSGAC